jgi:hypothetical protein
MGHVDMIAPDLSVGSPTITAPSLVSMTCAAMRKAKRRFKEHRDNSRRRDILFLFGFPLWIATWWESGHWHQRGRRRGQYVMARLGDRGAYSVDNIAIIPHVENTSAAHVGRPESASTRRKIRDHHRTPAFRRKMSRVMTATWAAKREGASP